jgi:FlgD Ig-like domain
MKKILVSGFLILAMGLWGYISWEEDGKAIRQESNLNFSGSVIHLSNGDLMAMWSDASGGKQEMKVQKVSGTGELIWTEPIVLTTRECYYPDGEILVESLNGEVVAAWRELDNPSLVRVQRIDSNGNLLWGDEGIIIELDSEAGCISLHIVSDETGGVYLVWRNWGNPSLIQAVYLEENGETGQGWDSEGTDIMESGSHLKVIADGFGGIVIASNIEGGLRLQRCNSQANIHWGSQGIIINDTFISNNFDIIPWSVGEYALLTRNNNAFKANIIDYTGEFTFDELQSVITFDEEDQIATYEAAVTSDQKLALACDVITSDRVKLVVQKGDIGEDADWGEEGVILYDDENPYLIFEPDIAADNAGGIYLSWDVYTEAVDTYEMCYQHLDSDGNAVNGTDPQILCDDSYFMYPGNTLSSDQGAIVFWYMIEAGNQEIRYQMFDSSDNALLAVEGNSMHSVLAGTTRNRCPLVSKNERSVVCWEDSRMGYDQVYLQLIDNNSGELLFAENGIHVAIDSDQVESEPKVCISNDGENICAVYELWTNDQCDWGIQIIDQEGNRLMGENGAQLNELVGYDKINLMSMDNNGFLVAWQDWNCDFESPIWYLRIQKVIDGQFVWDDGIVLANNPEYDYGEITLLNDKIAWVEYIWAANTLRMLSLDDEGNISPGWDEEGVIIAEQDHISSTQIFEDGSDSIILWESRELHSSSSTLFAQKVDSEGQILWEEGGRIIFENINSLPSFSLHNGSIYCVINQPFDRLTLSKLDLEGNPLWDEEVIIEENDFSWRVPLSFYRDKIIVYWKGEADNIYAKVYHDDGSLIDNIPSEGLIVCDQQHEQDIYSAITDLNGNSIVLWEDSRGEYMPDHDPSLYVQKLDLSTVASFEDEIIDGNLVNLSNYPNPFTQSTTLKCELPRSIENAEIVIYNIKGQKVRSLTATSNEVEWDCRNQAGNLAGSGMYFYKLTGKGFTSTTGKMIMLR